MTTQQATPDKDMNRNPTGKGGFGDHPENRNPGGWDKTKSISYQYNRMLRMTDKEWEELTKRIESGDTFRAERIAYKRIKEADNDLQTTKEITDRTEGKAPQFIGLGDKDDVDERVGATIVFEDKPEE